jgi:hypothetical protein
MQCTQNTTDTILTIELNGAIESLGVKDLSETSFCVKMPELMGLLRKDKSIEHSKGGEGGRKKS